MRIHDILSDWHSGQSKWLSLRMIYMTGIYDDLHDLNLGQYMWLHSEQSMWQTFKAIYMNDSQENLSDWHSEWST